MYLVLSAFTSSVEDEFTLENMQPTSVYRKGANRDRGTVQGYEGINSGPGILSLGSRHSSGSIATLPSALTSDKDSRLPTEESSRTVSDGLVHSYSRV